MIVKCKNCDGSGEVEDNGPKACPSCVGNGTVDLHDLMVHDKCYLSGKCQETEGFKGTKHEGVDMCEDGCVWFNPRKK